MSKLRFGILIALSGLLVMGCDDERDPEDAGPRDTGVGLMDSGPPPGDSGTPIDTGTPPPTDSGTPSSCGPTGGACNVSVVSSCGAGNGCVLVGQSTTMWEAQCTPSGVLGQGDACDPMMPSQCQEGFQCTGPMGGPNECLRICCGNGDCAPGTLCQQILNADGAGFCQIPDACDVTDASSCGDGQGCLPLGNEGDTQCSSVGEATEGQECAASNGCVAGFGCIGQCRQFCNPTSPDCPDMFNCAGLTPGEGQPAIPGIGVCVPMEEAGT
ncbi:MAG: hypothetical protein AB8I08_15920 [Sandaracinaceae bacterium]